MNGSLPRIHLVAVVFVLMVFGVIAADQPPGRAALRPVADRKTAPEFELKDSSGRTVMLKDYRGKVVSA
jgi:hypothetical protein